VWKKLSVGALMLAQVQGRLHSCQSGSLTAFRRAMKAMIDPILAAIPDPGQRRMAAARIAQMGEPTITDESVLTIDLPSGLARNMVWRNQFYIPGRGSTTETRSYRRLL
jgi:hypothetical protein